MSLLSLGNQQSVQDIYRPNGEFDQNRLNEHLLNFDTKYQGNNYYLCRVVRSMVEGTDAERPDSNQLLTSMVPYDEYKADEGKNIKVNSAVPSNSSTNQSNVFFNDVNNVQHSREVIVNKSDNCQTNTTAPNTTYSTPVTTVRYSTNPVVYSQGAPVEYSNVQYIPSNYSNAPVTYI